MRRAYFLIFPLVMFVLAAILVMLQSQHDNTLSQASNDTQTVDASQIASSSANTVAIDTNPLSKTEKVIMLSPKPTITQVFPTQGNYISKIDSLTPSEGKFQDQITIKGSGFSTTQGMVVWLSGGSGVGGAIQSWSPTEIKVTVPFMQGGKNYDIEVRNSDNTKSNKASFKVTAGQPYIASVNPTSFRRDGHVTIQGRELGSSGQVFFYKEGGEGWNTQAATGNITSWSDTEIRLTVPSSLESREYGLVVSTADGRNSSYKFFRVE